MRARITSLRDRPIAESERRTAMVTVVVLLLTAAVLLALSRPHAPRRRTLLAPGPSQDVIQSGTVSLPPGSEEGTTPLTPQAKRAVNLFLAGYLDYLYGHTSVSRLRGATPMLWRSLQTNPPRVSPGIRARTPRVVALHNIPSSTGLLEVRARINDGGLVDYSIRLLLARYGTRLLVNELRGGS
jgi:hypothetical protein